MNKYKNETDNEQVIVGVGKVPAGAEFQTSREIENPNFTLMGADAVTPDVPVDQPTTETNTQETQ